jgi:flagellar basal body P-ring protein FlgI
MLCLMGLLLAVAAGGCQKERAGAGSGVLTPPVELGAAIGSLAEVVQPEPVAVEGYGLVGGLAGKGSGYCPPEVREYLKLYILTQLPGERVDVEALLEKKDTAVVALEAMIPATPSLGEPFDVRVVLPAGSDATSLQGGWLYKAELVAKGTFGARTKPLATVEGPVFINPVGTAEIESRSGYILGGSRTLYEYTAILRLRKPDYRAASLIRNRLSERYGSGIAQALSPGAIGVRIPADYSRRKQRFIAMIPATFLQVTDELINARIDTYVSDLAAPGAKDDSEIALEAVGPRSVAKLSTLLNAPDGGVRLRVGRCMLGLKDNRGLAPLRDLAIDPASPYRFEALEAVMVSARRADAASLGRRLLRDDDVRVVLAAYEYLRRMEDAAVTREVIGRSFLLEQVVQSSHKAIFVSRSGSPRVVLFGAPLRCHDNLFVESPDQVFVLNSRAGERLVSVIRKHPTRPGVIGPLRSTPDVGNLVRTLGGETVGGTAGQLQGAGASYTQVIALLEQLSIQGAVAAEFWPGPLPKLDLGIKK